MASPPFNVAETLPGDTDIASQFPALERTYRDVVESWLLVNHNNLGQHARLEMPDLATDPTFAVGIQALWNNGGNINTRQASGSVHRMIHLIPGTKMPFMNAAPPAGWALDASAHDRVIRVNGVSGGGAGGTWNITGAIADGHSLTIAEMPQHFHDVWLPHPGSEGTVNPVGGSQQGAIHLNPTTNGSGPAGSGNIHGHTVSNDGTWRPQYIDMVVGTLT